MRLITGGRYQGKSAYAKKLTENDTNSAQTILDSAGKIQENDTIPNLAILDPTDSQTANIIRENDLSAFYKQCAQVAVLDHCEVLVDLLLPRFDIDNMSIDELHHELLGIFEEIIKAQPKMIFVMAELGCGVVPIDKKLDILREHCGRISCDLAARAESVDRMICGIPQRIAGN